MIENLRFFITRTINPSDLDPEYQHIHHTTSIKFLEEARLELLNKIGWPNQSLISQGLFIVLTGIDVQYLRELVSGTITISCSNPKLIDKTFTLNQTILNSKGKKAVEACVKMMFIGGDKRRGITPPAGFIEALEKALC